MPSTTASASSVYVEFGYEDTFGGGSTALPLLFGKEQKATGLEYNVNQVPLGALYTPEISDYVYNRNEGKVSMDYVLSHPWNFSTIFGNPLSASAGGGLFTHTWVSDPDVSTSGTITGHSATSGGDVTVTAVTTGLANSDEINISDTEQINGVFTIFNVTGSTFDITLAGVTLDAADGGTWVLLADPYTGYVSTRDVLTMALQIGVRSSVQPDDNHVRNISGAVSPTMSFKMSLNEPIRVTQDIVWGIESDSSTTLDNTIGTNDDFTPYVFANAQIELNGSVVATVQDFDLNVNSNAELLWEFGTPDAVNAWRKLLEMTGKLNLTIQNSDFFTLVRGRAEQTSMTVTITNGLAGTALKEIVMTFGGVGLGKYNNTGFEPGELALQDVDFQCRTVTIVATNDSDVQPASN